MDPQAALTRFLSALSRRDYTTANDAHAALNGWLARGGFAPKWTARECRRFHAYQPRMTFPTVSEIAAELRAINGSIDTDCDCDVDVRLQVTDDDGWAVHSGDAQYDTDHSGFWGASSIPGNGRRFNARAVARDLIEQARDSFAQSK